MTGRAIGYKIKNWEQFQHYDPKKRQPPWIKLHVSILNDRAFSLLSGESQGLLVLLWILASESGGVAKGDIEDLRFRLRKPRLQERDLQPLIDAGFISPTLAPASAALADASTRLASVSSRTEAEAETEEKNYIVEQPLDVAPQGPSRNGDLKRRAIEVLDFLNAKTGRSYQPVPAHLDMIRARLTEGMTVALLCKIVSVKTREWSGDERMAKYLRPATLFNRTKAAQYAGELPPDIHDALLEPDDKEASDVP